MCIYTYIHTLYVYSIWDVICVCVYIYISLSLSLSPRYVSGSLVAIQIVVPLGSELVDGGPYAIAIVRSFSPWRFLWNTWGFLTCEFPKPRFSYIDFWRISCGQPPNEKQLSETVVPSPKWWLRTENGNSRTKSLKFTTHEEKMVRSCVMCTVYMSWHPYGHWVRPFPSPLRPFPLPQAMVLEVTMECWAVVFCSCLLSIEILHILLRDATSVRGAERWTTLEQTKPTKSQDSIAMHMFGRHQTAWSHMSWTVFKTECRCSYSWLAKNGIRSSWIMIHDTKTTL